MCWPTSPGVEGSGEEESLEIAMPSAAPDGHDRVLHTLSTWSVAS